MMDKVDRDFPILLMFRRLAKMEKQINAIASALSPDEEMEMDSDEDNPLSRALKRKIGDNIPSHNRNAPSSGGFDITPVN